MTDLDKQMIKDKAGSLYVYRDEDGHAVAVAMNGVGPNGGWVGHAIARMANPTKDVDQTQLNEFAALFADVKTAQSEIVSLRDRLTASEAARETLEKKLSACGWYWPEDDTSEDGCCESAQDVVQNAYDWSSKNAGIVIAVARGGIVEVTYCASIPPAEDADSDDDFWVEEATHEAAQAKIDAEKARRATLTSEAHHG